MNDNFDVTYKGRIKFFKEHFGFISTDNGDLFFKKRELLNNYMPESNDEVEFKIKPSDTRKGELMAVEIALMNKFIREKPKKEEVLLVGTVEWFNESKGYGLITTKDKRNYFIHKSNLEIENSLEKDEIVFFTEQLRKEKLVAIKCLDLMGMLKKISTEVHRDLLQNGIVSFKGVKDQNSFNAFKAVCGISNISNDTKSRFLELTYEQSSNKYKIKMAADGYAILSQQEQTKIALNRLNEIEQIWDVSRHDRINALLEELASFSEAAKYCFMMCVYARSSIEYKIKMVAEGNISLTKDEQIQLVLKRAIEIGGIRFDSDYDKIKSILKDLSSFSEVAKLSFISSVYEQSSNKYKIKMAADGYVLLTEDDQAILQLKHRLDSIGNITYDEIKTILEDSSSFSEVVKLSFISSVYEQSKNEYKIKLVADGFVILTDEEQIILQLRCRIDRMAKVHSNYDYDIIKSILEELVSFSENVKSSFIKIAYEHSSDEFKLKMVADGYLKLTEEEHTILQFKYRFDKIERINDDTNYNKIKTILDHFASCSENVKSPFIKSAYEHSSDEFKLKMVADGYLKLTDEEKRLRQLKYHLDKIGIICDNNRYDTVRFIFDELASFSDVFKLPLINNAYKYSTDEYKIKMVADGYVLLTEYDLQGLVRSRINKIGQINDDSGYHKMKSMFEELSSFSEVVKSSFFSAAYVQSSDEYKIKMVIDGYVILTRNDLSRLVLNNINKIGLINVDSRYDKIKSIFYELSSFSEVDKPSLIKNTYDHSNYEFKIKMVADGYVMLSEEEQTELGLNFIDESDVRLLEQKLEFLLVGMNSFSEASKAILILSAHEKYTFFSKTSEFLDKYIPYTEEERLGFLNILELLLQRSNHNVALKVISAVLNVKLFSDDTKKLFLTTVLEANFNSFLNNFSLLRCMKMYDLEYYNHLINNNYENISELTRLHLWLNDLSPVYNYLEFIQFTHHLSIDERKIFNKRVKVFAKDERMQQFIDQVPTAEIIEEYEDGKVKYRCKWRNLYYKNGFVQVLLNKKTSTKYYRWSTAREEWNWLTQEYFSNRRVEDIIVVANKDNSILEIQGLEEIEVKIIIADIEKNEGRYDVSNDSLSSEKVVKIIHNISARNKCINFLAKQETEYLVMDVKELVSEVYGLKRIDISFIFIVSDGKGMVYLIWESAEVDKSKATHIFRCKEDEVEDRKQELKDYIEDNIKIRSMLNSNDPDHLESKKRLNYFSRVNHDSKEYQVWEDRMREELPFLK